MQGFQDLFVTALSVLIFSCVIVKFVSVAFHGCDVNGSKSSKVKVDANKVVKVVEQVNLGNALKVRKIRSKKRVKFVDDVVVRHIDQLGFERVVLSGEEGVFEKLGYEKNEILEGENEKDETSGFDGQKINEDGKNLIFRDDWNKGMLDESFEKQIIGENNGIAMFDQHLPLEDVNVIIKGDTEKVEILKCADVQRVNDEGKMICTSEETFELGYFVQEENLQIETMDNLDIEEKVIKEEASTSGSGFEGLMVGENMYNEGFSSQSHVHFVSEHATLNEKEDTQVERLNENMEGGLSERAVEEEPVEVLGENVEGGLTKKDEERAMKSENVVIDEEDDDWEGIERTELEKVFAEAVNYVEFVLQGKDDQLAKLGSDVQMHLYGLHKIAVEGPCHQAQPMALNFFARAKWNAWQKLGSMSPEVSMEEYIKLLTEHFPEWVQHYYVEDAGQSSLDSGISHDADE